MKNSKKSDKKIAAFIWQKSKKLLVLDQLRLPWTEHWITCKNHAQVAHCIKNMNVRGAPAIGCVAAYGLVLAAYEKNFTNAAALTAHLYSSAQTLASTRPTAVNLAWALERLKVATRNQIGNPKTDRERIKKMRDILEHEADKIFAEDLAANLRMGELGAKFIPHNALVLTHCNTGSLATSGWGTALGVIRKGFEQGKVAKVLVGETRPYLQGARLTTWELKHCEIPHELITDSMAAHLMRTEKIHAIFVGADRIAGNGDVANKIGTYALAVLAHYHKIPFYVVAPSSTVDFKTLTGLQIPIEERSHKEVLQVRNQNIAPEGTQARHPAFDVTPHPLISAIITEIGVVQAPSKQTMEAVLGPKLLPKPNLAPLI